MSHDANAMQIQNDGDFHVCRKTQIWTCFWLWREKMWASKCQMVENILWYYGSTSHSQTRKSESNRAKSFHQANYFHFFHFRINTIYLFFPRFIHCDKGIRETWETHRSDKNIALNTENFIMSNVIKSFVSNNSRYYRLGQRKNVQMRFSTVFSPRNYITRKMMG